MVATANSSFVNGSEFSRKNTPFFWTMVALAALDVILLFWLLNPVAKSADYFTPSRLKASQARTTLGDAGSKPSPLGAVATHVAPKLSRSRNNITTVAYSAH